MYLNFKNSLLYSLIILLAIMLLPQIHAQHRGDNLRFQGLDLQNRSGIKATAMGGAFTAVSGEMDAFFWNPAGMIGMNGPQITLNGNSNDHLWRESQDYRPNRQVVTMSFILDGLYMPNPEFNGWLDNEAFFEDSTYIINEPLLGADSYSEEAADWQQELDAAGLTNIAAGYPFQAFGKSFVVSAGYNAEITVRNYDRNQTHLTPHPAFDGYGDLPQRVVGASDSVFINWSDFERQRSGPLRNYAAALAVGLTENLNLAFGFTSLSGETDDSQTLNRIGIFELLEGIQIFRFRYDTLNVGLNGTSDFSATQFNLGAQFKIGKVTLGANIQPGYTITRDWNYTTTVATADSVETARISGQDKLDIPLSYRLGVSLKPTDHFQASLDIEHQPFADAEFNVEGGDATLRNWVDQTSFRVGLEFKPIENFSLMGGYRNVPQVFSPDGAADGERGPEAEYYTLGASVQVAFATVNAAWEIGTLKYYDVYFSNTNFAFERSNHFLFGITLGR